MKLLPMRFGGCTLTKRLYYGVFMPYFLGGNGPIALEEDTLLTALGFRIDPELGELDTPNGHMVFLQAVGLTGDEMDAMMCWNGQKFLAAMEEQIPLCVTDLSRSCLMTNPAFHTVWQEGMERDGSITGGLYLDEVGTALKDGRAWLRLGAGHGRIIANMLRAKVGKGRELYLHGREAHVKFCPGEPALEVKEGIVTMTLSEPILTELCDVLKPRAGVYPLSGFPLTVELVPTRITDQDGNVLEVIG